MQVKKEDKEFAAGFREGWFKAIDWAQSQVQRGFNDDGGVGLIECNRDLRDSLKTREPDAR